MKKIVSLIMAGCLVMVAATSHAQAVDTARAASKMERRKALKDKMANATPEQKEKMKEKRAEMKAKYDAMTPEQKEAMKEKAKTKKAEAKAKYDAMTPEQQQALKEKMKARREAKKATTTTPATPAKP